MGTFISGESGAGGTSAQPIYYTTVTAGEDVTQGQVAVLGADNLAYYAADPSTSANTVRPIVNISPITNAFLSATPAKPTAFGTNRANSTNASSSWTGNTFAGAALSNGNYVVAWQLADTPYTVQFAIFNNAGVQQGATVSVDALAATSATYFGVSIAALVGGGFVLAFSRNVTPWCQYAVYDNTGAVIKALTIVNAGITGADTQIYALALSNGGFALVYMCRTNSLQNFATYDAVGALVVAHTTIGGASGSGYVCAAAFCAAHGGGFVVAYSTPDTGTQVKKFTNAGVLVGAASTGGQNYAWSAVAVLTGGGYAVATLQSGTNFVCVTVFNAAGNPVTGSATTGTAVTGSIFTRIAALSGGDLAVACNGNSGNTTLSYWSGTTGALLKSVLGSVLPITYNSNSELAIVPTKSGGVSIIASLAGTQLSAVFDANANLINPVATIPAAYATVGNTQPLMFALASTIKPSADVVVFAGQPSSGGFVVGQLVTYVQKYVPIGVFTGPALKGNPVQIQYTGAISLVTSFLQPYTVDAQSMSPPGQRMSIIGNSVLMAGIQTTPSNRRNIN